NVAPMATDRLDITLNLNGNAPIILEEFNPERPTTFNNAVPSTVFDSLGNSHQLTQYFVKGEPEEVTRMVPNPDYDPTDPTSEPTIEATTLASVWEMYYALDGQVLMQDDGNGAESTSFKLYFDTEGRMITTGV